ncbi:MAG: hypothetical protein OEW77_13095 [Gemmatimonadota bacterium]|nr:hypothetical protein [Gemmatimonadota bacterium]
MVRARAGKGLLGSLLTIVFLGAVVYFGFNIGNTYWRYLQFEDRMKQEARFAAHRSDLLIARRLRDYADSLKLPVGAHKVNVRRRPGTIQIWAEYYELVEFPGFVREIYFHPQAVGTF